MSDIDLMNSIRGRVSLYEQRPRSRLLLQIRRHARHLQKGLTSQLSTEEAAQLRSEYPERIFGVMAQILRLCELARVHQDATSEHLAAWRSFRPADTSQSYDMRMFELALTDALAALRGSGVDLTWDRRRKLHEALGRMLRSGALVATSVGLSESHFRSWALRDLAKAA